MKPRSFILSQIASVLVTVELNVTCQAAQLLVPNRKTNIQAPQRGATSAKAHLCSVADQGYSRFQHAWVLLQCALYC